MEDKVAFNYKLNDDFSESSNGLRITDFVVYNTYSSNGQRNPHKSYGYLRTPEVAEKIYQFLTKDQELLLVRIWYNVLCIFAKIENKVRKNKYKSQIK